MKPRFPAVLAATLVAALVCAPSVGAVFVYVDNLNTQDFLSVPDDSPFNEHTDQGAGATAIATLWTWTITIHTPLDVLNGCSTCTTTSTTPAEQAAAILEATNVNPCQPGTPDDPQAREVVATMIRNRFDLSPPNVTVEDCNGTPTYALVYDLKESVPDTGAMKAQFECHAEQAGFLGPWSHHAHMEGAIDTTILQAHLAFLAIEAFMPGKCSPSNLLGETLKTNYASSDEGTGYMVGTVLNLPICGDMTAQAKGITANLGPIGAGAQIGWDISVDGTLTAPNPLASTPCGLVPLFGILEIRGEAQGIGV